MGYFFSVSFATTSYAKLLNLGTQQVLRVFSSSNLSSGDVTQSQALNIIYKQVTPQYL